MGIEGNNGVVSPPPPQALLERLKDYGQEDVFALWDELSHDEREYLVKDIEVNSLPVHSPSILQIRKSIDRIHEEQRDAIRFV